MSRPALDRPVGSGKCLPEHLAAKYRRSTDIPALSAKNILLDLFKIQMAQQICENPVQGNTS